MPVNASPPLKEGGAKRVNKRLPQKAREKQAKQGVAQNFALDDDFVLEERRPKLMCGKNSRVKVMQKDDVQFDAAETLVEGEEK